MDAAAFRATYADWRLVKGRKVVQVVFEVPLELADRAYKVVGGMPNPAESSWFAIARLTEEASPEPRPAPSSPTKPDGAPKTYAKRLGIACGEPAFWRFLETRLPRSASIKITKDDDAADAVRFLCGVKSRTETVEGTPAGEKARALLADYRLYMSGAVA